MKKFLNIILSAVLLLTLAVPAAAADAPASADQRLAQVTAKVKRTLGIGDEYEEFSGNLSENELCPVWDLNWSSEGEHLTVEATESGKILSYYTSNEAGYGTTPNRGGGSYLPAFPAVSREQAQKSAEAFLAKVLDSYLETAQFFDRNSQRLSTSSHYFGGEIRLNGLPSPLTFSLTVRASDGKVIRFYRESTEQNTIGGVPSAQASASQSDAAGQLKKTMKLRLEYVLDPDANRASLRYLPESGDEYYVDAQTGELVNLTELYKNIAEEGYGFNGYSGGGDTSAPEAAADMAASTAAGLSQAELSGISKLEGVQDKDALDKEMRKITALGLGKYTFASASYSLDKETEQVTARLVYSRKDDEGTWRRTVSCDGKTGELLSVYSSAPYSEDRKASVSEDTARKTAETFLTDLWGDDFAKTAHYKTEASSNTGRRNNYAHSFRFVQQENGYFFPENSLRVSVDITDGTISGLERMWTEDVAFDSAEGIIDAAAALDAWADHYDIPLAYRNVPVKLDPGTDGAAPLLELGYSYFYSLRLSYAAEEEKPASGVDARSGKVVYPDIDSGDGTLTYSDTSDHWARTQIETLAQYGIGWTGGACQPRKELTQLDLVALLASADGYRYDPKEEDAAEDLYRYAYSLGILTRGERQDDKLMTRGETVRLLLSGAGFGRAAGLQGIFTCSFADRDQIPADMMGWAALAQGLGVVSADGDFAAGRTATRAEAIVMLYQLMSSPAA